MARGMRSWAMRRLERRIRQEWQEYDHHPEVKLKWPRRADSTGADQNVRPFVQVNFYRQPRR
jgi:hypothetical protein